MIDNEKLGSYQLVREGDKNQSEHRQMNKPLKVGITAQQRFVDAKIEHMEKTRLDLRQKRA